MANVIVCLNCLIFIFIYNKILIVQFYGEFKEFFFDNVVEYFVFYYDYYQLEVYIFIIDIFIEKDFVINEEVDKLWFWVIFLFLLGWCDIIIVAFVFCIYGMGNLEDYKSSIIWIKVGQIIFWNNFLYSFVNSLYLCIEIDFWWVIFCVKGDIVDINLFYVDFGYWVVFFGDEIEFIDCIEIEIGKWIEGMEIVVIFFVNLYIVFKDCMNQIIWDIEDELYEQEKYFECEFCFFEVKCIKEWIIFDLEMIWELGYCNGVENYFCFFDGCCLGICFFCLFDYFLDDYFMIIDESYVMVFQVWGMYGGDCV